MDRGYYVYSGIGHFTEPLASFSNLEDAERLSAYLGSHTDPTPIDGELPGDIDLYVPMLRAGQQPFDVALYGDGSLFELDNGFEGSTLTDPIYFPDGDSSYSGTFWANNPEEAIEKAQKSLTDLLNQN